MAAQTEINELKRQWRNDPCWDIEETEGFEEHRADLLVYRRETEREWSVAQMTRLLDEAQRLIGQAMAIAQKLSQPAPTCPGCGAPLDADGECPRAADLDASLAAEAGDEDTEELPAEITMYGNLRHSGVKWGLTGNEIRYSQENPMYDQPQPAPKEKLPRVFPDEVFMPDDYIPMDEY